MTNSINHVAIIMDGNGRWAEKRLHKRVWGHVRGASIVSDIVEEADELNIGALTLYAFSSENWSRPSSEVEVLFLLLKKFIIKERNRIIKNLICFKVMGNISGLPESTKKLIYELEEETKDLGGLKLTFAFGYGGQDDIVQSINSYIESNPGQTITAEKIEKNLLTKDIGNVDLLIRTGGDQRISNFLLWQIAYAELAFTSTPWPAFTRKEFRNIYSEVSLRKRRFGSLGEAASFSHSAKKALDNKKHFIEGKRI